MVRPDHRRRGVGRALLAAVRREARRRGLGAFLIVRDDASPSGAPFLAAFGARRRFSEHLRRLDRRGFDRSRPPAPSLLLRPAGPAEAETLARLQAAAFDEPLEETREHLRRGLREPNRRYYAGVLRGEPVGMLRVGEWGRGTDITALGVLPERRGRGYGRRMLLEAVELLLAEGNEDVAIEVATDNRGALGLYESCGFERAAAYAYHEVVP